jgi:hypothetical protein
MSSLGEELTSTLPSTSIKEIKKKKKGNSNN